MKQIFFSFLVLGAFSAFSSMAAYAQYYDYNSGSKPSVEINLDALGGPSTPNASSGGQAPENRAAPVSQIPLNADQPATAEAPARKTRLLKPVPAVPERVETPEQPAPSVPPPLAKKPDVNLPVPEHKPAEHPSVEHPSADSALPPARQPQPSQAAAQPRPPAPVVPALADLTISFNGNICDIDAAGTRKLDNIISQMQQVEDLRVQVRAYASGEDGTASSARRISLSRALAVRSYMMDHDIKPARVDVRALGSGTDKTPLDRVDIVFVR